MGAWKAKIAADNLVKEYAISEPNELPLEDIVIGEQLFLEEKSIKGADGRIVFGKNHAVIIVNKQIQNIGRKRFVIAHELGHFKMHRDLRINFQCTEADFLDFHKKGSHEMEANVFAAEFLMPSSVFKKQIPEGHPPHQCVFILADKFQTSWTATALRFVEYGNFPSCLFFSKNGFIKWYKSNGYFAAKFPRQGENVPLNSVAADYYRGKELKENPGVVQPIWFKDSLPRDCYFYEFCLPIPSQNSALSLVWRYEEW